MLKEKYYNYKLNYKEYVILLKSGNFYLALNTDAIVMNTIFNYKIKQTANLIKVGFPLASLNKVLVELERKNINYIVIDSDITSKKKFKNNAYNKYYKEMDNYEILGNRINKINDILKNNLNHPNIKEVIEKIENILCKINY